MVMFCRLSYRLPGGSSLLKQLKDATSCISDFLSTVVNRELEDKYAHDFNAQIEVGASDIGREEGHPPFMCYYFLFSFSAMERYI
jgi:hypothetical protein